MGGEETTTDLTKDHEPQYWTPRESIHPCTPKSAIPYYPYFSHTVHPSTPYNWSPLTPIAWKGLLRQPRRPRRKHYEIIRPYKCGWNGCDKAYGTLNHLNAHVTMQAHGAKRSPEAFKEIRQNLKKQEAEKKASKQFQHVEGHTARNNGSAVPLQLTIPHFPRPAPQQIL